VSELRVAKHEDEVKYWRLWKTYILKWRWIRVLLGKGKGRIITQVYDCKGKAKFML